MFLLLIFIDIVALLSYFFQDRWQAAIDGHSGNPLPGEHYLTLNLILPASRLTSILIDFETAHSSDYAIEVTLTSQPNDWVKVHDSKEDVASEGGGKEEKDEEDGEGDTGRKGRKVVVTQSEKHVINEIKIGRDFGSEKFNRVRLRIRSRSTQWGTSVWRFQVFGLQPE